jgi:hypothetical protein
MSPPTKAPDTPVLDRQAEKASTDTATTAAPQGGRTSAPPHAAVLRGQQTAGNRAMAAVLGAPRGVQRAPNDGDQPVDQGMADAQARATRRVERANVEPIRDPDVAARIYLDQGAGARGNLAMGRRDMFESKWRYDHHQQRPAPVAGWRNADGTVVIDKSNPQVRDAVERLARERGGGSAPGPGGGGPGGGGPGGGGPGGGGPGGGGPGGGGPDRGDPRRSGMAHAPTLDTSGGVATAPTFPGPQRGDPRRSGMAYGPTLDSGGGMATGPTTPGAPAPGGAGPAPAPGPGPGAPGPGGGRPSGPTITSTEEEGDFPEPPAPRRGNHPAHIKPAVPATKAEAEAAYRRDPSLVYRSQNDSLHGQYWRIDPGTGGGPPPVYRSGKTYIVAPGVTGPGLPPPRTEVTQADEGMERDNIKAMGEALDRRRAQTAPTPVAPGAPASPGQQRIDPYARRREPEPGMRPAVPVTHEEVAEALRKNPDKVYQSKRYDTHAEWYTADRGRGAWPRAYRSGNTIIVDPGYPLDGSRPDAKPTGTPARGPDPTTQAAQTISPTGYVPQERKPAKWDVKQGTLSRETTADETKVGESGSETRSRSSKQTINLAKGVGQEWKQREETRSGDKVIGKERYTTATLSPDGITIVRGRGADVGQVTPEDPDAAKKTKTKVEGGATIGPGGVGGTGTAAIESKSGAKAEAKGTAKMGKDSIEASGTAGLTSAKGFTGHLTVSGKHHVVASDPKKTDKGKFAVTFTVTDEKGVSLGGGWNKPGGTMSVGLNVGSSESNVQFETRVFDSEPEAKLFQLTAAMVVTTQTKAIDKASTADGALAMKEGEVAGSSKTESDTIGGSFGISQVSVGVASTDSTTRGLRIEKVGPTKVRVTPSVAETAALNASISAAGLFSNTKGGSETTSFKITYEFDLSTEAGKKVYETYLKQPFPPPMPPYAKWIDSTTGHQLEDHDVYKFSHIGEIGWGSHSAQETVEDESGRHTTTVGGKSEKVELNAIRKLTFDKNRHSEANIISRMDNGQVSQISAQMTVGGEDGEFNRKQFREIFMDKGAPAGTDVTTSGEWTLTADIDKKLFESLERSNEKMKLAKNREERLKIYSEMAQEGGARMLMGQVRASGKKLAWNLELKGDPNFPGAAGRAQLNAQRARLQAQLKEKPDTAGSIAAEAKDALTALTKRLKAVSDKKKYTDLPDELRDEQVELINTHIAEFKSVRSQALSVQMRGGRKEDFTVVLRRAADEHGYDDVKIENRAWRKAQDLVTIHETELSILEAEIVGTRKVVMRMFGGAADVRMGKGVHQQVWRNHNANAKLHLATFKSMAPRLTEAVGKMREQKEKWSAEPDPKARENLLREYDAYVISAREIMDVQLTALRDAATAAFVVAPDAAVAGPAAEKVWQTIKVDRTARLNAAAGRDDDGSTIE